MEDRIDIPESFLERLLADKRKLAAAIAAVVVALALVAGLVYARAVSLRDERVPGAVVDNGDRTVDSPVDESETPAEETETVPAGGSTPSVEPTGGASGEAPTIARPAIERAPFIAYRLEGALYVAREDGTRARKVASNANGVFALSPDGMTLAHIDDARARLILTDIAKGTSKEAGQAL
ncbi:MAG: hypothetical protein CVT60_07505, partial [Actinobacteria bacterium HGW-Actinobacteria-10]